MIPSLFAANYIDNYSYSGNYPTNFPPHGDVDLVDSLECFAEENEDEGSEWELELTYPINGLGVEQLIQESNGLPIGINKLILAKANDHQDPQFFRIYSIEKRTDKNLAIKAQHISYDMINNPVKPYKVSGSSSSNPTTALNSLRTNAVLSNKFYFTTDITSTDKFEPTEPRSMRAMLLDGDDSIKGTYGGDLIFNNFYIQLKRVGGADRGVVINYGVDLVDMEQESNISEMVTGILPYYRRSPNDTQYESNPIIYGSVVNGPGTYSVRRIEPVDLSEFFPNNVPTSSQITDKGREWVSKENIGVPDVSLTVTYAHLGQDVRIHDAVRVVFPSMKVDVSAKVVKYRYNVLLERCEEIDVGHAKSSKLFNLMDASRLRKGLVPPERIKNESITDSKIARGGVGKGKIGAEAVGKLNIEHYSIDHELLSQKSSPGGAAVRSDNIQDSAVGTNEIDNEAVTTDKLDNKAVTTDKIEDKAVKTTKIDDKAVIAAKIADQAVESAKIKNLAVGTGKIVDEAISNAKLNATLKTKIASIDTLAANVAYVKELFSATGTIEYIYSSNASIGYISANHVNVSQELDVTDGGFWYGGSHAVWGVTSDGTPVITR